MSNFSQLIFSSQILAINAREKATFSSLLLDRNVSVKEAVVSNVA